jgi:hypothetical protein
MCELYVLCIYSFRQASSILYHPAVLGLSWMRRRTVAMRERGFNKPNWSHVLPKRLQPACGVEEKE